MIAVPVNKARRMVRRALGLIDRPEAGGNAYWRRRHSRFDGSLRAVGNIGLTDAENQEDYAIRWEHTARVIADVVPDPRGRHLLDAGCGSGVFSRRYADAGFRVVGVDVAPAAIAAAARTCEGEFHEGDLAQIDLGRRFAVVACHNVLMCVVGDDEVRRTLRNLGGMIEPGGHLLVQEGVRSERAGERQPSHIRLRTVSEHRALLSEVGLEIVREDDFGVPHEPLRQWLFVARLPAQTLRTSSAAGSGDHPSSAPA